jgi:GT2 family glycosyltransferase
MKGFDVVIATYNRHEKVSFLIHQLLSLPSHALGKIIVVDSSETLLPLHHFPADSNIQILSSSHKNQPYQRMLGLQISQAEFVLFLDDDMEVIDDKFPDELAAFIKSNADIVGFNLKFDNVNPFLQSLEPSVLGKKPLANMGRALSGYPAIADNGFWLAGIRGKRVDNKDIEYVSGGSFLARRQALFQGISVTLLDIFEKKLGMGEDLLLGYALSRKGRVYAWPKVYFVHNDQGDSTYTSAGFKRFYGKISYSRLFLSLEYVRLNNKYLVFAIFHYGWFIIWRIVGLLLNLLFKPDKKQLNKIYG